MKLALFTTLVLGLGGFALIRWWRPQAKRVSPQWLMDCDRMQWTSGQDGVAIKWPIKKLTNEAGTFNAQRLRKRA